MTNGIFTHNSRLDTEFLNSIYENDNEHAVIVFEQFLINYPVLMSEIEESFIAGNTEFLRQKVHKLKPTLSFVGLTLAAGKAEMIEKKCKETYEVGQLTDLYNDLKMVLRELIPAVEEEFESLKAY